MWSVLVTLLQDDHCEVRSQMADCLHKFDVDIYLDQSGMLSLLYILISNAIQNLIILSHGILGKCGKNWGYFTAFMLTLDIIFLYYRTQGTI